MDREILVKAIEVSLDSYTDAQLSEILHKLTNNDSVRHEDCVNIATECIRIVRDMDKRLEEYRQS